jgi:hypothetical protein
MDVACQFGSSVATYVYQYMAQEVYTSYRNHVLHCGPWQFYTQSYTGAFSFLTSDNKGRINININIVLFS